MIEFRIYRTSKWVRDPFQEVRYGGPPPHQILEHTDTLQTRVDGGDWIDVPIVAADPPPHPFADRERRRFSINRIPSTLAGLQVSSTTER